MKQDELGKKLRIAREFKGLSQSQAAEAVGLPRTSITQIEAGRRSVSTLELTKFAKLYQKSISSFLEETQNEDSNVDKLLFRAKQFMHESSKVREQISHYINLCKEGILLEKLLQYDTRLGPPQYNYPAPKNKSEAVLQGTIAADQERNRLSLGVNPIGDLASLISNQGIWACSAALPDDVSGLFFNMSKTGMIILVNADHVKSRKRFSYAHEYAHALFDRDDSVRISSADNNSENIEVRANAFAAAFLMPFDGIVEALRTLNKGRSSRDEQIIFDPASNTQTNVDGRSVPYSQSITFQDVAIVAHAFGVSYQATVYRLRSLNLISIPDCERLIANYQAGRRFLDSIGKLADLEENEKDAKQWDRELRTELAYLAVEAYRREEISRGRVIELGNEIGIGGDILYDFALAANERDKNNNIIMGGYCENGIKKNIKC